MVSRWILRFTIACRAECRRRIGSRPSGARGYFHFLCRFSSHRDITQKHSGLDETLPPVMRKGRALPHRSLSAVMSRSVTSQQSGTAALKQVSPHVSQPKQALSVGHANLDRLGSIKRSAGLLRRFSLWRLLHISFHTGFG